MDTPAFTVHGPASSSSPSPLAALPPQTLWLAASALGLVVIRILSLFRHA